MSLISVFDFSNLGFDFSNLGFDLYIGLQLAIGRCRVCVPSAAHNYGCSLLPKVAWWYGEKENTPITKFQSIYILSLKCLYLKVI